MFDDRIKSNTNYIFIFGKGGVGKSTLLSVICKYLSLHNSVDLHPNISRNPEGSSLYFEWLDNLKDMTFPERTRVGTITQIELALENLQNRDLIPLSFLEMSGEDLSNIDIRKRTPENRDLVKKFEAFLNKSKLFLLVTDVKNARKDDTLFLQFIQHLQDHSVQAPVALIVSKWDELSASTSENISIDTFVSKDMEHIDKKMRNSNINYKGVFSFSIGEVLSGNIKEIKIENCTEIATWIYDSLIVD